MKLKIVILILGILSNSFAKASNELTTIIQKKNSENYRKTLDCVAGTIEKGIVGEKQDFVDLMYFLKRSSEDLMLNDSEKVENNFSECNNKYGSLERNKFSGEIQYENLTSSYLTLDNTRLDLTPYKLLLENIIKPTYSCSGYSRIGQVGFIMNFRSEISNLNCIGSSGFEIDVIKTDLSSVQNTFGFDLAFCLNFVEDNKYSFEIYHDQIKTSQSQFSQKGLFVSILGIEKTNKGNSICIGAGEALEVNSSTNEKILITKRKLADKSKLLSTAIQIYNRFGKNLRLEN